MPRLVVDDAQPTGEIRATAPAAVQGRVARVLLRWLPAAVVAAFTFGVLLAQETAPLHIARYSLYLAWGLVLPGTLVYRALRRVPHSLVDDLAMGTALGFVLELVAWAMYSAAELQGYLWTWPAFVVVPFLAVPALHRHWRTPHGYRVAPVGWSWAVAAVALTFVAYLGVTALDAPPTPRTEAGWYYLDLTYLLSLVTEAIHHFPLHSPQVASEPLNYHWFTYAHMASSSLISGVDAPVVYFRFVLPVISLVSVILMAVVGWRVTGRPWVGALATALMFVVAEFTTTDFVMFGMIGRWTITVSPSQAYAWLSTLPLILIVVDRIRRTGLPESPLGRGAWLLLALFAAAASGAKATILFVLLGGLGLAGLAELIRRKFPRNVAIASAIVLAVIAVAMVVLYRGESGGMKLSPLQILRIYMPDVPRSPAKEIAVLGFMGVAYAIYMLARLAGIPVLAWLSWRRRRDGEDTGWSVTEWFLLGGVVAGIAGTHLLWHLTWAQAYMLRSAWPFAVILSALGLAVLVERHRVPARVVVGVVVGSVVLAATVGHLLFLTGLTTPGRGSRAVLPIYWAALATLAVCVLIGLGSRLAERFTDRVRGVGAVSILVLILVTGVPVALKEIYVNTKLQPSAVNSAFYADKVTPDGIAVANWLKANTPPDEVLATNAHCPSGDASPKGPCLHLTFWLSAYSERRVVVGGWGYVPRSVAQASRVPTWSGAVPFFDPHKLAVNDAAFYAPTAAGLAELRDRYEADWLVVDRSVGHESPVLRELAPLRFERGDYAVYELR